MKLDRVFQDGMILQRELPVNIWGEGTPGEEIRIEIQGEAASVICGEDGKWRGIIPPLAASDGETLTVTGGSEKVELHDVAIGEIYLAAGQSNMEFYMRYEKHFREGNDFRENPRIRFYDVPKVAFDGQEVASDYSQMAVWRPATKEHIEYFSAAAYYAAVEIHETQNVPVGIVGCNWGGTSSVAWMSPESASQTAKSWVQLVEKKKEKVNWETYYQEERCNPRNYQGLPFADEFTELMLPRTPSKDEIAAFFAALPGEPEDPLRLKAEELPGCLYEHMVKRIAPFTLRAVLYYQGESDDECAQEEYHIRLKALMQDWRELWEDPDLPFFLVQLPGFREWMGFGPQNWQAIRRSQERVTDEDAHAHLCSISDAGEEYDIHPKDKKIVGHRLALLMRRYLYQEDILADAPRMTKAVRQGEEIFLTFDHAGEGLKLQGDVPEDFSVSAPFVSLKIEGDTIRIRVEKNTEEPIIISMGQSGWYRLNLYNSEGIPVIPFVVSLGSNLI